MDVVYASCTTTRPFVIHSKMVKMFETDQFVGRVLMYFQFTWNSKKISTESNPAQWNEVRWNWDFFCVLQGNVFYIFNGSAISQACSVPPMSGMQDACVVNAPRGINFSSSQALSEQPVNGCWVKSNIVFFSNRTIHERFDFVEQFAKGNLQDLREMWTKFPLAEQFVTVKNSPNQDLSDFGRWAV